MWCDVVAHRAAHGAAPGAVAAEQQEGGWAASRGAHRVLDLAPVVACVAHREEDQLLGRCARLQRRLEHARHHQVATRKGQRLRVRRRQRRRCCVTAAAREPLLAALRVGEGCGRRGDGIRQRCGPYKRRTMPPLCHSRRVVLGEHAGLHGPVAQLVYLRLRLGELHALQLQLVLQLPVVGCCRYDVRDREVAHHDHGQRGGDCAGHAHAALLCWEKRDLYDAGPQQKSCKEERRRARVEMPAAAAQKTCDYIYDCCTVTPPTPGAAAAPTPGIPFPRFGSVGSPVGRAGLPACWTQ